MLMRIYESDALVVSGHVTPREAVSRVRDAMRRNIPWSLFGNGAETMEWCREVDALEKDDKVGRTQ